MRIAVFGNSGSGKSTLARHLAVTHSLPMLELDNIVWEPQKIAVLRDQHAIHEDLRLFLHANEQWVVEGCYGELIALTTDFAPEFVFLNPGVEVCVENNRTRPWEPHKYASKEAQDQMLAGLVAWVEDYYRRDDGWSLVAHRRLFDAYSGPKREIVTRVDPQVFVPLI
jgi:adenylate kinase family enzyme